MLSDGGAAADDDTLSRGRESAGVEGVDAAGAGDDQVLSSLALLRSSSSVFSHPRHASVIDTP